MARTMPMAADGKKNRGKNGPAKVAMKARGAASAAAAERSNPFESIWSRRKFDVLGKKRKGEERRVARSRSEAIRKRDNTLLKEFKESAKSSVFRDRRIGERDDTLPEFDKAILRQQRERLTKLKRESKYNLSDEDEGDINVDDARNLSGKDDFDEEVPLDDESDDEGKMILSENCLPLQSGVRPSETDLPEECQSHKSKKEVMMEIISKSKSYKAQKAKEKEGDEHLVDKLDSDFSLLAQTQALLSLTESAKVKVNNKDSSTGLTGKEIFNKEKPDTYEKLMKEMVMDQRARPSDRTKTSEEIGQEEKETLEKLEMERQKRMLGSDDSSNEDDDDEDDHHTKMNNSKHLSGEDLGDSFTLDESIRKKGLVDDVYEKEGRNIGDDAAGSFDGEIDDEHSGDDETDNDKEKDDAGNEDDSRDNDFGNMSGRDWEQSDDDEVGLGEDEMEDFVEKEQETNGKVVIKGAQTLKRESNAKPQVSDGNIP